ncbi:carboxypeptidase-like regulatory domain-containing protein [Patiriisocius marinus]|uniref:carboxypeptidase-like regulatory domain-containing protein n=1 Tax=Patiriisocius marinus TaxID=1397112 RepID=UPI00232C45B0|nr:carboxypeptidase-like regulatory domain-containing protein [Patiriisocius marinus]
MKKAIHISIPEPCHEDWSKMTPTQKGKHCASCEKEVTDYTQKTDEELVKLLSNNGNSCGRFKESQINREVKFERKSSQAFAPFAASLLIPLSLMSSLTTKASSTDNKNEKTYKSIGIGRMSEKIKTQVTTTGVILDRNRKALNNVIVYVKETGNTVYSNNNGEFSITSLSEQTIVFEKEGFSTETYTTISRSQKISIKLLDNQIIEPHTLGEPMVMGGIRTPESIKTEEEVEIKNTENKPLISNIKLVKGTITDSSGLPLPGVNIIIKGTTIGTQSDFDGNYTIGATKGQTLVYSYVGFDKVEKQIFESAESDDILMLEGMTLGEVVWTGGYSIEEPRRMVTKPDFYANEEEVAIRKKRYKNVIAFLKLKIERKKEARQLKRAKRKVARILAREKRNTRE